MTPDESQLLQYTGVRYYLENGEAFLITVFFYGVFVVLFSVSVVNFMRRGFSNRATVVMFGATGLCFLLSTLYVGTIITAIVQVIQKTLTQNIDDPLSERLSLSHLTHLAIKSEDIIILWSVNLPIWVSDLIVIWRASVFFPDQRWVIIGPSLLWLSTIATSAASFIWITTPSGYDFYATGAINRYSSLSVAGVLLSTGTNAITTAIIAYKLWSHRKVIVKDLGLKRWRGPVQSILIVLVESGLFYLVLQIILLVLAFVPVPEMYEALVFDIYGSVTQMYPTIVILLVETQRSMVVVCGISPSNIVHDVAGVPPAAASAISGRPPPAVGPSESATRSASHPPLSRALQSFDRQENWRAA